MQGDVGRSRGTITAVPDGGSKKSVDAGLRSFDHCKKIHGYDGIWAHVLYRQVEACAMAIYLS